MHNVRYRSSALLNAVIKSVAVIKKQEFKKIKRSDAMVFRIGFVSARYIRRPVT